MVPLMQYLTADHLATLTGIDVQTVLATAKEKRLGYGVEGVDGPSFAPDHAARLLMALQPNTYILLSAAAARMKQPAAAIMRALQTYGPLEESGFGPVISNIGPHQDALIKLVAADRAWKVLDANAEIAARASGRGFVTAGTNF